MIAFEIHLNGKKLCTAGVGEFGVLSTGLTWRGPQPYKRGGPAVSEHLRLNIGGLADSGEHLLWQDLGVKRGDSLTIKIIEVASADKPRERQRPNPAADLKRQKQYVRRMANKFGWKIQT